MLENIKEAILGILVGLLLLVVAVALLFSLMVAAVSMAPAPAPSEDEIQSYINDGYEYSSDGDFLIKSEYTAHPLAIGADDKYVRIGSSQDGPIYELLCSDDGESVSLKSIPADDDVAIVCIPEGEAPHMDEFTHWTTIRLENSEKGILRKQKYDNEHIAKAFMLYVPEGSVDHVDTPNTN